MIGGIAQAAASNINAGIGAAASKRSQERAQNFNSAQAMQANVNEMRAADTANRFTAGESQLSRNFNADQAQLGRDFSSDMFDKQTALDNSAVQRKMKDLELAGLNPMLAMGTPGGAGSPSGMNAGNASSSSGTGQKAGVHSTSTQPIKYDLSKMGDIGGSINSALAIKDYALKKTKNQAEVNKINAEAESIRGKSSVGERIKNEVKGIKPVLKGTKKSISKAGKTTGDYLGDKIIGGIKTYRQFKKAASDYFNKKIGSSAKDMIPLPPPRK